MRPLHTESLVVTAGRPHGAGAPLNPPVVLTAPYRHGAGGEGYLRQDGSETVCAFEHAVGELEGGTAHAFASGMAAITAVIEGRPAGGVIVAPDASYSGTGMLLADQERLGRATVREVDITDTDAVLAALPGAALLWVETPTNPMLGVADLPALVDAAHAHGALVCVDATFTTPLLLRALDHGADLVVHSATKYLAGHSDLLMGVVVTRSPDLAAEIRGRRDITGAVPGALESYLALRGLRTLALRMDRAQATAGELARRLVRHPRVSRVRYPGLPDDPSHERASRLHAGYGAMISFEVTGSPDDAERICQRVQLITHATSLGGVESLIERRARHEADARRGVPPTLLRLSVGIEHVEDLWSDLDQALSG